MQRAAPPMPITEPPNDAATRRIQRPDFRPLFFADWSRAVFIHYETDADLLQSVVPYQLDLRNERAYVSLVAFTMERMRFGFRNAFLRRASERLLRPISEHAFLNVRTYVKASRETGIYFLAEWLSNRLSVPLGPIAFGLPYRQGRLDYQHGRERIFGKVNAARGEGNLSYRAPMQPRAKFRPSAEGSLEEFLMERYTAFTRWRGLTRFFHVQHEPWPQVSLSENAVDEASLLGITGKWSESAKLIGAHFSPGVRDVRMGWPHFLKT